MPRSAPHAEGQPMARLAKGQDHTPNLLPPPPQPWHRPWATAWAHRKPYTGLPMGNQEQIPAPPWSCKGAQLCQAGSTQHRAASWAFLRAQLEPRMVSPHGPYCQLHSSTLSVLEASSESAVKRCRGTWKGHRLITLFKPSPRY